jgi:hypothetical protein
MKFSHYSWPPDQVPKTKKTSQGQQQACRMHASHMTQPSSIKKKKRNQSKLLGWVKPPGLSLHAGSDQAVKSTCVQVNTKEKKFKLVHGSARKAMDQASVRVWKKSKKETYKEFRSISK